MSFFDDFPVPPEPEPTPFERKPWMGPPPGWVGGWVPWHLVLARTADLHLALSEVFCFPSGVEFSVAVRLRPDAIEPRRGRHGPPMWMFGRSQDGPRFGVGLADGTKAAMGGWLPRSLEEQPSAPLLWMSGGGGGSEESWRQGMWLWPLPPPGPLALVAAWPALGVAETTTVVEAAELLEAATKAEQLWPDTAGSSSSASGAFSHGIGTFTTRIPPSDDQGGGKSGRT